MQGIRHKAALSLFALALTLYAGGKLCSPPARASAGAGARSLAPGDPSGAASVTNDASALRIVALALSTPPTNAVVTTAFGCGAFLNGSLMCLWTCSDILSNDWTIARADLLPAEVTMLAQSVTFSEPVSPRRFFRTSVYEPRLAFPGLPSHLDDDGTSVYVATDGSAIPVFVDRTDRPVPGPVTEEELMANPFHGIGGLSWNWEESTVSAAAGQYALHGGDRLVVISPEVRYGESHEYQGTRLVADADGGECREVSAYPLDSPCLWEHWHEGTNAVGTAACSCVPSLELNVDVSAFPSLTTSLTTDGETATGKVFLDGREIWSGSATHSRYSESGGRSDALTEDGCSCECSCADGNCDALEGPSLGSVRFRIPLGVPRENQVSGFLWFESEVPFTPSCADFRLLCRSDASVEDDDRFDARTVTCRDCRGRTVEISDVSSGVVITIADTATREPDCIWRIVRDGQTMRFRKFSRLDNLMVDRSYTLSGGVWSETDNVSSVSTVRTVSGDPQGRNGRWEETVAFCGSVTGSHVRVRSDQIGWDQDALVRETERWEKGAEGRWKKSYATYWDSVGRRHGQLRMTWGDDRDWSWHDYDESGRETFRLEQRDGSAVPSDGDYSLACLPADTDAFATVLDYEPFDGDSNHANDTDKVRTLSRYVVGNGAPTLVERTWTKYVHAMTNGLPCVVVTTVRACSQDAACGDPGNAVTVSVSYDAESPIVPYALRGETVAYTDEDGVTELYGHTLAGGVLRTVSQRVKGAAEAKTRTVTECDATYGNVLYEATQLTADPSVEFAWRRMSYDEKNRLRLTRYDDGSFETNACSCCRLLWRVDRTGAKTLRSATTGTDHLYWAEEDLRFRRPEHPRYGAPGWTANETWNFHRVTKRFCDGFGRETNTVVTSSRTEGAGVDPGYEYGGGLKAVTRTDYPQGVSDVVETTSPSSARTRRVRLSSPAAEMAVHEEFAPDSPDPFSAVTNFTVRGGGTVSHRSSDGKWTRTVVFDEYGSDGCRTLFTVAEASDLPTVTNTVARFDFLGRMVRSSSSVSDVAYFFDGAGGVEMSSLDYRSGIAVTNLLDSLGETVGTVSRGVKSMTEESYFFRLNAWWRLLTESVSSGAVTNSLRTTETRVTGLSDALRSEERTYVDGVLVEESRSSFDPDTKISEEVTDSAGHGRSVVRSRYGLVLSRTSPSGSVSEYQDPWGRVYYRERTSPSGTAGQRFEHVWHDESGYVYGEARFYGGSGSKLHATERENDFRGNVLSETDPCGNVVRREYDGAGRIVSQDGDTYPVRFGYDTAGRRTSLKTTREGTDFDETTWTYDAATGLCTSKTYADGSSVTNSYAADGLPLRTTYQSGCWTERIYDGCRRAIGQTSSDPRCAFALALDAFGRTVAASNSVSRSEYALANCGVATNESVSVSGRSAEIRRSVDVCGRVTALSVDGHRTRYHYDPSSGMLACASNDEACVSYAYDAVSDDLGWTLKLTNGTEFTRTLSRHPYLNEEVTQSSFATPVATNVCDYTYDACRRPVSRGGDTFAYNRRGEVASATIAGNAATYAYDGIGNSTASTWNGAATTYVANELNQYTRITRPSERPESLWYDVDGNLESVDGSSYDYDALSRLTVARTNGVFAAAYAYDHLSRRVRKAARDGVHTYFYDGWKLVLELIEHNGITDRIEYVWGKDISGTLDGAAGIGGLLYTKINGAIYVPQYDAYGNIIEYCDSTGAVVATYTYDAFGRTIAQSGALADVFAFRYSTKYFDRETGFYYYGKRYYSPALRCWITRDPIGVDGGVNLYGFCGNAAVCRYDAYGQSWSSCFGDCFENWRLDWVSLTAAIVGSSLTTLPKDPQELRGLGPVAERRSETSAISKFSKKMIELSKRLSTRHPKVSRMLFTNAKRLRWMSKPFAKVGVGRVAPHLTAFEVGYDLGVTLFCIYDCCSSDK